MPKRDRSNPDPKSPVQRSLVLKLIRDVSKSNSLLNINALKKLAELAAENEKNQKSMAEAGVAKAVILFVLKSFRKGETLGLEEALRILQFTWSHTTENKKLLEENADFIQSMLWILKITGLGNTVKTQTHALIVLKKVIEVASATLTAETLNHNFFTEMVNILRGNSSPQAKKAALGILIQTCPFGRNRIKIIEAGAVFELIEMELANPEKKITDLIFCLLAQLCSCADGRQQFLKHSGGIAVVAKRLLRVSPATDDRALYVIESIARFSATREVVMEMLRVGAVSKVCMVLQADCADYLKKKAREILRLHSRVWSDSPCIQVYLLTRIIPR
ncbi:hypothetical protein DH2020_020993 [Rehmannia glutinosa]|uniref:U-box domain-containing protein n=1 Tax=Rehmannia glutinosa TaxID=99300 RepID=A0ABR0W937_REHGL